MCSLQKKIPVICFIFAFFFVGLMSISLVRAQTFVSGKVTTSDGMIVASGVVALEKGELHNNAFLMGGAIGSDGAFKIPLPSGGAWGIHVYSEKYIYFPLQVQIKEGVDNEVPVILPVDGNSKDDPRISDIQFKKLNNQVFQITMQVDDPNNNLGPQMVAIDTKRFKSYRFMPEKGDLKDWKANFPRGKYVSPYIPVRLDGENLKDWLFVVADHQCSNGPIYNGLGQSFFKPPVSHSESLLCEIPGIWKSNFDKVYKFSRTSPGMFAGEQLQGDMLIDKMAQKDNNLFIDFRFKEKKGKGELRLLCRDKKVMLKGNFKLPDRSGDWIFYKLKNAKAQRIGEADFMANCAICHYHDSKDRKVGPGLSGLFKNPRLPDSGLTTDEKTVREQILNGGKKMPPFRHLKKEQITAIIEYLKSL
jgi:hypothetical protein